MSRSRRRYSRPTRGSDGHWGWRRGGVGVLVLLTLAFCGWWWFQGRQLHPLARPPLPTPAASITPTNAVVLPPTTQTPATSVGVTPVPQVPLPPEVLPPLTPPLTTATNTPPSRIQVSTNLVRMVPSETFQSPQESPPPRNSRPATDWMLAQLALISRGISPGSIDGVGGAQSMDAVRAFQADTGLETNGQLDRETRHALSLSVPATTQYVVSAADLGRLVTVPSTWVGKSSMPRLDYESILELVGEQTQSHPGFLRRLNPSVDWAHLTPGDRLTVPTTQFPPARRAALVRISLGSKWLRAFDDRGRLLAHFPCSIAASVQKRPVGTLNVAVVVKDPNYTMDPAVFPESAEARTLRRKLVLNPGPNNPVGVAWIGLNRSGYGIHGTPNPEQVGRTESHGCFRLANWNAEYLRQMSWVGLRVSIER